MKLSDLLAPALIGLVAFGLDVLFKGPVGIVVLLYAALPGIIDAIVALGAYAAADYTLAPYLGLESYPTSLVVAFALGFLAFSFAVNYFLLPFRTHGIELKRYYLTRYPHLKAALGLSLLVARPLAYLRHTHGIVHTERAYEASLAVLIFTYVLTPLYEFISRKKLRTYHRIVIPKSAGRLGAGVEVGIEEVSSFNGRVLRLSVRNEEPERKQFLLAFEVPDYRIPNPVRTRSLEPGESDDVFVLVRPSRFRGKRPLRIYVYDASSGLIETIPEDEPMEYELYAPGFALSGLLAFVLLVVTPLAAIFAPPVLLGISSATLSAITAASTILIGRAILSLVDRISASGGRRVVHRLDELAAAVSVLAIISFLIGLLTLSLEAFLVTMFFSAIVLVVAVISPLVSPARVEIGKKPKGVVDLRPVEPDYFEESSATLAELVVDAEAVKRLYGADSFRIFLYGDDPINPPILEVRGASGIVRAPVRIIPDGFGERELVAKFSRLLEGDKIVPIDDADVLIGEDGKAAVYVARYKVLPAGSAGVPRELQQLSMRAIAMVFSPTLILNVLNYLGLSNTNTILSVIFGTIAAMPVLLYLYYRRSS